LTDARALLGGLQKWTSAGKPLEKGKSPGT
jgi:3-mercaptopyruvate sulfurtransferase SseA